MTAHRRITRQSRGAPHYRYQIRTQRGRSWRNQPAGRCPRSNSSTMDGDQHKGPAGSLSASRHGPVLRGSRLGPYVEADEIREVIVDAAKIRPGAGRCACLFQHTLESGWIPSPLPAVYTGDAMKKYREWLPSSGYEVRLDRRQLRRR